MYESAARFIHNLGWLGWFLFPFIAVALVVSTLVIFLFGFIAFFLEVLANTKTLAIERRVNLYTKKFDNHLVWCSRSSCDGTIIPFFLGLRYNFYNTDNTQQGVNCLNQRPPTGKKIPTDENKRPDFDCGASEK